ncbi:hypothetical protein TNIN_414031 [Trichonephila inaurata madagascariensis]|uniref:Endonuclease/exonuclease/phosphatase domain-containing protein n=1 Tax=Trichonephila inaurata madagascariensis TaxID=2747483 RepID=A0A8X6IFC2_9ARAC|nr:hypothetical protein TNIN_414031 [Trichonephila inaurata madagascariensis]
MEHPTTPAARNYNQLPTTIASKNSSPNRPRTTSKCCLKMDSRTRTNHKCSCNTKMWNTTRSGIIKRKPLEAQRVERRTILVGDLNAHSNKWSYHLAGDGVEDLFTPFISVFCKKRPAQFVSIILAPQLPLIVCLTADTIDYIKERS